MPIYAVGSGYHGDLTIADVRKDRDSRLSLFLKEPGQKNILVKNSAGTQAVPVEPMPDIWQVWIMGVIPQDMLFVKEVLSIKFIVCKARDLLVVRYSVRLKHC